MLHFPLDILDEYFVFFHQILIMQWHHHVFVPGLVCLIQTIFSIVLYFSDNIFDTGIIFYKSYFNKMLKSEYMYV